MIKQNILKVIYGPMSTVVMKVTIHYSKNLFTSKDKSFIEKATFLNAQKKN